MKNTIIVIISLIIIGNILRWILIPITKNLLKEFTNPYLVAHRKRMMMHIPCIVIRHNPQINKKKMREFYYMEADLELFQHYVLKYFEDYKIKSKVPSLTDIVNRSMLVYDWKTFGKDITVPVIYIQFGFHYKSQYHRIRYDSFRNRIYFAKLIEDYAEKDFPEIKQEDDNLMIPLSYFAEVVHEDKNR